MLACPCQMYMLTSGLSTTLYCYLWSNHHLQRRNSFGAQKGCLQLATTSAVTNLDERKECEIKQEKPRFRWTEIGPDITEEKKQAISEISPKMTNRCRALLKQIICFSSEKISLSDLLASWVRSMRPRRADWLVILKELRSLDHPLLLQVAELALLEESFEANNRDYTKLIDAYGQQNRLQDVENILSAMKRNGFIYDQVLLTTVVHIYSKAGNLKLAEEAFEEMKLLGVPLDKRSYGSMIMAYIRAGLPERGESILREMEEQQIYPGREVFKALLRAYSMRGDAEGAQRVFDAIQLAGISPNEKLCALLINAYGVAGRSLEARSAFENMRIAGIEPTDKCIARMLAAYEKENMLNTALDFLINLEKGGVMVGKEASEILARWFHRLGVIEEVELVLRGSAVERTDLIVPAS